MNIYVYGDESGNFDLKHDVFVFGGLIFTDKKEKDKMARKYAKAENDIADQYAAVELKASILKRKHRLGLFRSTNQCFRYAFIVHIGDVEKRIFNNKKTRQRFLDFVFKVGIKKFLEYFMKQGVIDADKVENLIINFDEHQTATDGKYELREAIEQELKLGTFNYSYSTFYPPIFPTMSGYISLNFCDSKNVRLIRASDIIANRALGLALKNPDKLKKVFTFILEFPL